MWEAALADKGHYIHTFLWKLVESCKSGDISAKIPRPTATHHTVDTVIATLKAMQFRDAYSTAPIPLPVKGKSDFMQLTIDRIVNRATALVPLVNHSVINTKLTVYMLNGFGAAQSGGICYNVKKFLYHLLHQTLIALSKAERAAVEAAYAAA